MNIKILKFSHDEVSLVGKQVILLMRAYIWRRELFLYKQRTLTQSVINNSSAIIPGRELKDLSGNFQVDFYQNLKSSQIYTQEMKAKFN